MADGFVQQFWNRLPTMFIVLGLAMLGFNRRAAEWEAQTGNEFSFPVIGVILLVLGVGLWAYNVFGGTESDN